MELNRDAPDPTPAPSAQFEAQSRGSEGGFRQDSDERLTKPELDDQCIKLLRFGRKRLQLSGVRSPTVLRSALKLRGSRRRRDLEMGRAEEKQFRTFGSRKLVEFLIYEKLEIGEIGKYMPWKNPGR